MAGCSGREERLEFFVKCGDGFGAIEDVFREFLDHRFVLGVGS